MAGEVIKVFKIGDSWDEVVTSMGAYDFYHLSTYHRIAQENGEGEPFLFVFQCGERKIAVPFLRRPVSGVEGLESAGERFSDVTSVYGYPGPLSNCESLDKEFLDSFIDSLYGFFQLSRVVTAFTRLHPVLKNHLFFDEEGLTPLGRTVSIDLSLSHEEQRKRFRANHRRSIKKVFKAGVKVFIDEEWKHLDAFLEIYQLTMDRVKALQYYYFDREYFLTLRKKLGDSLKLCVAEYEGRIISAGLFTVIGDISQYHLGGTLPEYLKLSAFTSVLDVMRGYATDRGCGVLHLGGGLGSGEDNLFHFKAGFSGQRHQFYTWKFVAKPQVYEELKKIKIEWNHQNNFKFADENYFPQYRSELVPLEQE